MLNRDFGDQTLRAISPVLTYPRIFIDGALIGGTEELANWIKSAQSASWTGTRVQNEAQPLQNNGKIMKGGVTA